MRYDLPLTVYFLCLFTLLGYFSGLAWAFDLMAQFRMHYVALAACLFAVVFYFGKTSPIRKRLLLLCLASMALNTVAVYLAPVRPLGKASSRSFKLMQFNVNVANQNKEGILSLIEREKPDIVCLMEVDQSWTETLDSKVSPQIQAYPGKLLVARGDPFGMALLSKFKIKASETLYFNQEKLPSFAATIELPGGADLTLVVTHPLPPLTPALYKSRNQHLRNLCHYVSTLKGENTIVCGDFNSVGYADNLKEMAERSQLKEPVSLLNLPCPAQPPGTWPAMVPPPLRIPIDHVFMSQALTAQSVKTDDACNSDHVPLITTINY
ncbi:MAG: endonuclease/exonuclease/phosphatase family protein [Candidatus Obscuribacter sp.]|nr:endonuclease/exonuclease/phosphatase family protein [Candidatus Obscuribacter sp.]